MRRTRHEGLRYLAYCLVHVPEGSYKKSGGDRILASIRWPVLCSTGMDRLINKLMGLMQSGAPAFW